MKRSLLRSTSAHSGLSLHVLHAVTTTPTLLYIIHYARPGDACMHQGARCTVCASHAAEGVNGWPWIATLAARTTPPSSAHPPIEALYHCWSMSLSHIPIGSAHGGGRPHPLGPTPRAPSSWRPAPSRSCIPLRCSYLPRPCHPRPVHTPKGGSASVVQLPFSEGS